MQLNVLVLAIFFIFFIFFADLSAHFAVWFFIFNWATFRWRICSPESSGVTDDKVTPLSDFSSLPQRNLCRWPRFIIIIFNDSHKSSGVAIAMIDPRIWVPSLWLCATAFSSQRTRISVFFFVRVWMSCKHQAPAVLLCSPVDNIPVVESHSGWTAATKNHRGRQGAASVRISVEFLSAIPQFLSPAGSVKVNCQTRRRNTSFFS